AAFHELPAAFIALKNLRIVGKQSGEVPLQSANHRSILQKAGPSPIWSPGAQTGDISVDYISESPVPFGDRRTVRAKGMITLATKTDKDAPTMKRAKCTTSKTSPLPSASSTTSTSQFHQAVVPTLKPPKLLKIAQRDQ
ncbi:hypothetical protein HAX54_048875, partial [Datura stramonium]|nr:hypothetical protein [Datura stramonium]